MYMMQEPIGIPACFSSGEKPICDPPATITKSGQSVFASVYRTKVAGQCRMITITWCKNILLHGLSITIEGPPEEGAANHSFKIELKPWYFWRKQGSNRFQIDGKAVNICWDLRTAKFNGETEPQSDYYVAVVCEEEAVLLLGDRNKDACRKTGSRQSLIEPILVSKKEHIFGKKKFSATGKFHEKGRVHEISIECSNHNNNSGSSTGSSSSSSSSSGSGSSSSRGRKSSSSSNSSFGGFDPEMEIRIDGHLAIHVKHLQWKFRGNECISVNKIRVEVYWDVHDWLFSHGLRHALFIFKPISIPSPPTSSSLTSTPLSVQTPGSISAKDQIIPSSSEYCLFLYAWRVQ